MPITRHFLGFDQPALAAAVDYLVNHYVRDGALDLSRVTLVLPGGRAKRRLLELLIERADRDQFRFKPPHSELLKDFPESLYESRHPFASDLTQRLAWVRALQSLDSAVLAEVFAQLPPPDETARWLPLGEMLARLHRELAADGLDFADVAAVGDGLANFTEVARWEALSEMQRAYLRILDELEIWDKQTARLVAVKQRECRTDHEIILIGMADLNRSVRQMLDQVAEVTTALIVAEPALADHFDAHGCLIPEQWETAPLPIDEQQIRQAYRAAEQAEAAVRAVADLDAAYAASEIVIGLPNEPLAPLLSRKFDECGQRTRWVSGRVIEQTGPYQLLAAIAEFLQGRRLADLAALLRHADLYRWLREQNVNEGWLEQLDDYRRRHLPARASQAWLGREKDTSQLRPAFAKLEELLEPLTRSKPSLDELAAAVRKILIAVYGNRELSRLVEADHYLIAACRQVDESIDEVLKVTESLRPELSAAEFLRLLLDELSGGMISSLVDPEAIELLGWLELPLDDKPALVLTSMNEGYVPQSVNADPFLPNRLRQALKLDDNLRRLARDAYTLHVLLRSRESLTLIVGKVDAAGDAVAPSRLLFHDTPEVITRRAQRLFGEGGERDARSLSTRLPAAKPESGFVVPMPRPIKPVESLRVTALRTYLECPYRFYLAHVLKLKTIEDDVAEMDAGAFGDLLHEVLAAFGDSEARHVDDRRVIEECLDAELNRLAKRRFGDFHLPSVEVQLAQVRARLFAFARWQADWAKQGWRIRYTEWKPDDTAAPFDVDGKSIYLRGRVDRIDENERTGEWIVLDYKSGNKVVNPQKTHFSKSRGWIDFQLPLYRYVVQSLEISEPQLGYVAVGRSLDAVGELIAEWTPEELAEADQAAAEIIRAIRAEEFWPLQQINSPFDDFAAICQASVYERRLEGIAEEVADAPDADEGGGWNDD